MSLVIAFECIKESGEKKWLLLSRFLMPYVSDEEQAEIESEFGSSFRV